MDRRYKHLNGEERGVILAEHRRGASLGAIGLLRGRNASTIGRELLRGRPERDPAQPYCAQRGGSVQRQPSWPVATTTLAGGAERKTGMPVWRAVPPA